MRYENETLMAKFTFADGKQVWREMLQSMIQTEEDDLLTTEEEVRDLFYSLYFNDDEDFTSVDLEYSAHPLNGKGNDVCITTRIER